MTSSHDADTSREPTPAEIIRDSPPHIATTDVPLCPVCAHDRFSPDARGYDYELRSCVNRWRFVRCTRCSHVWLNPRPENAALSTIYPGHYYAYRYAEAVPSLARRVKDALDRRKFEFIARSLDRPLSHFCDVGCGDGRYLRFAQARGVHSDNCIGLELDQATVDRLTRAGFTAFNRRVEDCTEIPDGSLDLLTMFHVIEHVDDPCRVIQRIVRWLAPGGVAAIETPNLNSLDARLFRRSLWGGYHIPRHWNMFTPATLNRLLTEAGLAVQRTRFVSGHSFWMYSFHHALRYAGCPSARMLPIRAAISRPFDPFGGLASLPALAAFTAFDTCRAALGFRTSSMLMIAHKPPAPRAVYTHPANQAVRKSNTS